MEMNGLKRCLRNVNILLFYKCPNNVYNDTSKSECSACLWKIKYALLKHFHHLDCIAVRLRLLTRNLR
jgi:hypothetical protein